MQTIQGVNAEQLAKLFHHYHEALTHDCDSQKSGVLSWDHAPESERKLMIAAARLTLLELSTTPETRMPERKYFAKPGEADWGCLEPHSQFPPHSSGGQSPPRPRLRNPYGLLIPLLRVKPSNRYWQARNRNRMRLILVVVGVGTTAFFLRVLAALLAELVRYAPLRMDSYLAHYRPRPSQQELVVIRADALGRRFSSTGGNGIVLRGVRVTAKISGERASTKRQDHL